MHWTRIWFSWERVPANVRCTTPLGVWYVQCSNVGDIWYSSGRISMAYMAPSYVYHIFIYSLKYHTFHHFLFLFFQTQGILKGYKVILGDFQHLNLQYTSCPKEERHLLRIKPMLRLRSWYWMSLVSYTNTKLSYSNMLSIFKRNTNAVKISWLRVLIAVPVFWFHCKRIPT